MCRICMPYSKLQVFSYNDFEDRSSDHKEKCDRLNIYVDRDHALTDHTLHFNWIILIVIDLWFDVLDRAFIDLFIYVPLIFC